MHALALAQTVTLAAPDWDSGLLLLVKTAMQTVAVLIVVIAAIKGVKEVSGGKPANAVKWIVGSLLLAAVLWSPTIINSMLDTSSKVTKTGVDTITDIVDESKANEGGTTADR